MVSGAGQVPGFAFVDFEAKANGATGRGTMPSHRRIWKQVVTDLFTARNVDGKDYRVSVVWWPDRRPEGREWISVARPSMLGEWEAESHTVVAEAAVWRNGLGALIFRPKLLINYEPDRPQRLNKVSFREIVREIIERADLVALASFEADNVLESLCHPYRLIPIIGYRLSRLNRRIPHLMLFEWPADRAFPFG
jgi:hypothetical protein